MKYNTTYTSKLSLKDTLEQTAKIQRNLHKKITSTFNLLEVNVPVIIPENSDLVIRLDNFTRHVSYDLGDDYTVVTNVLSHTNWLRDLMKRLEVKDKTGVLAKTTYIWRDAPQNPISTPQREVISFMIKLEQSKKEEDVLVNTSHMIYSWIMDEADRLADEVGLKNEFPESIPFASAQMLENEFSNLSFGDREIKAAVESNAVILENPGKKLFSGVIHSKIPPYLYDPNLFRQILLYDQINSDVLKVASIGVLSSGQILQDQLGINNMLYMKEMPFYESLIEQDYKVLEVKINLSRLFMALLHKGHVGEVQAGVYTNETKVIADRYKIDII